MTLPREATYCISGTAYQERHDHGGRLCDFLVFFTYDDDDWCAAVEMKSGRIDASVVVEQLQAGALVIQCILGNGKRTPFAAVLAHRGRMSQNELRVLRSRRIRFGGRKHLIRPVRCGSALISALA